MGYRAEKGLGASDQEGRHDGRLSAFGKMKRDRGLHGQTEVEQRENLPLQLGRHGPWLSQHVNMHRLAMATSH